VDLLEGKIAGALDRNGDVSRPGAVLQGEVEVLSGGTPILLAKLGRGEVFGEIALLDEGTRSAKLLRFGKNVRGKGRFA